MRCRPGAGARFGHEIASAVAMGSRTMIRVPVPGLALDGQRPGERGGAVAQVGQPEVAEAPRRCPGSKPTPSSSMRRIAASPSTRTDSDAVARAAVAGDVAQRLARDLDQLVAGLGREPAVERRRARQVER